MTGHVIDFYKCKCHYDEQENFILCPRHRAEVEAQRARRAMYGRKRQPARGGLRVIQGREAAMR